MIPADSDNIALAEAFRHYSEWYAGDPHPLPIGQDKEVTDGWWADTFRRLSEALSSFKAALEGGELTVKLFDPQRNMSFAITPGEWRDHRVFAGFLSSIGEGIISESEGDSLAKYNGLAPYVARDEFNAWFAKRKGLAGRRGRVCTYDWPSFDSECTRVLVEEGEPGVDPEWACQADLERRMTRWCENTWGRTPSNSTIRARVSPLLKSHIAHKAEI